MTDVNVRSIDALLALRTSLVRFSADTQVTMSQLERELVRTQEWLLERQAFWLKECERWRQELAQAQRALRECEAESRWDDRESSYRSDCSGPQARVAYAASKLSEAETELKTVRYYIKEVDRAGQNYRVGARRLLALFHRELVQAVELLSRLASKLQSYINLKAPSAGFAGGSDLLYQLGSASSSIGGISGSVHPSSEVIGNEESDELTESTRFAELAPASLYKRNGYWYVTDSKARVEHVYGQLALVAGVRTTHQTEVGHLGLPGDEGGHLIGTQFNGSPEGLNLVPQNADLNRKNWKTMESEWAEALREGKRVHVNIKVVYRRSQPMRPYLFQVAYSVDRDLRSRHFRNRAGG